MLEITKDDYRKAETKKLYWAKIAIAGQLIYEIVKIMLLSISYISCSTEEICKRAISRNISWFLVSDIIESALLWFYTIYLFVRCFALMRKYSRLEYGRHMVPMSFNFLGLFLCFPLVMWGKYIWLENFCTYLQDSRPYLLMYFSGILPATTFIFTRLDHDCFNCFNRVTP